MPAQMAKLEVNFQVDANGMLTVSAIELRSGQHASVTVQASHGLSQEEVERLVLESVDHAHEDFTMRRFIELKNKADADLRHTERAWAEASEFLTESERERITAARSALQAAMSGKDVDALFRAGKVFEEATLPLATVLMNAVVKKTLSGKKSADLDANQLD